MKELSNLVKISFVIAALYLVLRFGAQSRGLIVAGGSTWANLVKTLQGR